MSTTFFQDIAYQTADRDIPVIRLKPRSKVAFETGWPTLASTSIEQIDKWAYESPNANAGAVAKATLDGFCYFESDDPSVLTRIETETRQTIRGITFEVQGRPGRYHFYFKQTPESIALGNIAQHYVKHEDWSLRVDNEYVVAAGSIHPDTGEPYTVVSDARIIEFPSWLIEWCKSQRQEKKKKVTAEPGEPIPDGKRNTTLASIAGSLREAGAGYSSIITELREVNDERCQPPYPDSDLETIARSICRYPQGHPENEVVLIGGKVVGSGSATSAEVADTEIKSLISVDGDQFMTEHITPRRALLRLKDSKNPIFVEQSINQIFAWRGGGKTCLGFGLAGAFAKGGSLLNWEAPQRSRVLYIEGELPASQAQERWRQIIGETNGYARLITIDKQEGHMIPSLASALGMARIEKTLADLEAQGFHTDVLILDSISTLFNIPANDEESWLTIQSWLISLRSRGLCIFFFHHAGKSGMSRSHSKSEDMLDISIRLDTPKEPERGCLHVVMQYDKARAGFSEPDTEIKMFRVHTVDCACHKSQGMLIGCPGDKVRWETKSPLDNKKSEAEHRFSMGISNSVIAKELAVQPDTVKKWRQRWTKGQQKEQGID